MKTGDARDTQPWRNGTGLIVGESIFNGIDEQMLGQNGLVKIRVLSGTTFGDYYVEPLFHANS